MEAIIFASAVSAPLWYLWYKRHPFRLPPKPFDIAAIRAENALARKSPDYKEWRNEVFKKDGYKCVWHIGRGIKCGAVDNLEADHIYPFAYFPDLRFDVNNGRTLCSYHHKQTTTYGTGSKEFYRKLKSRI